MPHYKIFDKLNNLIFEDSFYSLYGYVSSSGNLLLNVKRGDKYGIIDTNGREIIEIKYDEISWLERGLEIEYFIVESNGKVAYFKDTGEEIIGFEYEKGGYTPEKFRDGLVLVKKKGEFLYLNEMGDIVPKVASQQDYRFYNGLAKIKKEDHFGFINNTGEEIIECKFNQAWDFDDTGYARVNYKNKWGFIDKTGNLIVPAKFDSFDVPADYQYKSNIRILTPRIDKLYGILAPALKKMDCECKYNRVHPLSEDYIAAKIDKQWGLINLHDEVIIPYKYDKISISQLHGLIFSRKAKKWVVSRFDTPLKEEEKVDEWYELNDALLIKKKDQYYIWNETGKKEISIDSVVLSELGYLDKSFFRFKKGSRVGIMNNMGEVIIETHYDQILKCESRILDSGKGHFYEVVSGGKSGVINEKGEIIINVEYDRISYMHGYFIMWLNGKQGYLNPEKAFASECIYDNISIVGNREVNYLVCSKDEVDSLESKYFIHIEKNPEKSILCIVLCKDIGEYVYILAMAPAGGGLFGEICAKIKNVQNWDITEGFFSTDLSPTSWEYYYKGELCEKSTETLIESDLDIFEKLNSELFSKYLEYASDDAENPSLKKDMLKLFKGASYISSTATWIFKNLSKHWGLKYGW